MRITVASRREWIRRALTVLGGAAGWNGLRGGLTAEALAARPAPASANPVVITWQTVGFPLEGVYLLESTLEPLLRANPGLRVEVDLSVSQNNWSQGNAIASMLAGDGPDIPYILSLDEFVAPGLLLDLAPYVRRDNIDLSTFFAAQIDFIRATGAAAGGRPDALYGLPQISMPMIMVVNLGILDQLGLRYPEPGWTYADWTRLWEAATLKPTGGRPGRAGGTLDFFGSRFGGYGLPAPYVFHGWGGEYVDAANPTRSALASPASIACGEWAYPLLWEGVIQQGDQMFGPFQKGQLVSTSWESDELPLAAQSLRGLKWDFFELPRWPVRPCGYNHPAARAIWAGSKHPDEAWMVLKWIVSSPAWARMQMRTAMFAPNQPQLYPEWIELVRQVAPPLRDKNLEAFTAVAQYGYLGLPFRYLVPQVGNILSALGQNLMAHKTSVASGFRTASAQLDAAEVAGAEVFARERGIASTFATAIAKAERTPTAVRLPAPPWGGLGAPPAADATQVVRRGGVWTVTGGGGGVRGTTDACTFACTATTESRARFVCRLVAIRAVRPATINTGAKFGLMVRGDLSDDAASVGLEVAAGRGVHFHVQATPAVGLGDQRPSSGSQATGLVGAAVLLRDNARPAANYLVKPLWLKLERQVATWSAFTSWDGVHWVQAGNSEGCQFAGGWVGLYVTAHGAGDLASATFDHLEGFVPDTFVRLGSP